MSSSTGGYLKPTTLSLPNSLTLEQFIQTVIVGISGYSGPLVRPSWQISPPKTPDIDVNWIAYGITTNTGDANAYVELNSLGTASNLTRQESLQIGLTFYGPNCLDNAAAFRDGFQLQQNLDGLRTARMGFTEFSQIIHAPELVNERWFNRCDMTLTLARQVLRTYEIVSFASASGIIHTDLEEILDFTWETPEA